MLVIYVVSYEIVWITPCYVFYTYLKLFHRLLCDDYFTRFRHIVRCGCFYFYLIYIYSGFCVHIPHIPCDTFRTYLVLGVHQFAADIVDVDGGFNYSLGNDVYNYHRRQLESGSSFYNQTTAMLNRWSFDGHVTDIPVVEYGDPVGNSRFSDRWIEDGSYLKLKNVRLTYTVPYSNSWLLGLKVWAEANNLVTITKYLGTDPEMSSHNGALYQGIDTGLIPCSRNFNIGVSINL